MSYDYQTQKKEIFTEDGVLTLLRVRDTVQKLLEFSGAFTFNKVRKNISGTNESWTMFCAIDYMVEKEELREVTGARTIV